MNTKLPSLTLSERPASVKATRRTVRVYYRQSLDDEKQQSIDTQRSEVENFSRPILTADEWAHAVEYIDMNRSGGDFEGREDLDRLMRDVSAGDIVLTWKGDRIGRDIVKSATVVQRLVLERRAVLYMANKGPYPVKCETAQDTMMVLFDGFGAQQYREDVKKNTRDGLRRRAREGYASGKVGFGWKTVPVNPGAADLKKTLKRIEKVPEQMELVRRIALDLYVAQGHGISKISKILNAEGTLSPKGKGWTPTVIYDLLRDARYAGQWAHGTKRVVRRQGDKTIFERAPESEIIRLHRPDLACFSDDEWQLIQQARTERSRDARKNTSTPSIQMLTGTIYCKCGSTMRTVKAKARGNNPAYRYYICPDRLRTGRCDNATYFRAEKLEAEIIEEIRTNVLPKIADTVRDWQRGEVDRAVAATSKRSDDVERLQAQLVKLKAEKKRLIKLAASVDDADVVDELNDVSSKAKVLEQALAAASRPPIDAAFARQLEAAVVAKLAALDEQLDTGKAREAIRALYPDGLRFRQPEAMPELTALRPQPGAGHQVEPVSTDSTYSRSGGEFYSDATSLAFLLGLNDPSGSLMPGRNAKIPFLLELRST